LPKLLVFSASPADAAAPQKLAYQEIARSAVDTEILETGPRRGKNVERVCSHSPALLSSHPILVMALAELRKSGYYQDQLRPPDARWKGFWFKLVVALG